MVLALNGSLGKDDLKAVMRMDMAIEGDSLLLQSLVPSHCHMASASRTGSGFSKSLKIVCMCVWVYVYGGYMMYIQCGWEGRKNGNFYLWITGLLFPVED